MGATSPHYDTMDMSVVIVTRKPLKQELFNILSTLGGGATTPVQNGGSMTG